MLLLLHYPTLSLNPWFSDADISVSILQLRDNASILCVAQRQGLDLIQLCRFTQAASNDVSKL